MASYLRLALHAHSWQPCDADGTISYFKESKPALGAGVRTRFGASATIVGTTFSGNVISANGNHSGTGLGGGVAYTENGGAISLWSTPLTGNSLSSDAQPLAVQSPAGSIYVDGQPAQVQDLSSNTTVASAAPTLQFLTGEEPWVLQTELVRSVAHGSVLLTGLMRLF
jgi:hypothetical protein